jgi:hypothetical protein
MRPAIQIPAFAAVDQQLRSIRALADYDPLLVLVRSRFEREMTHHLTPLKDRYGAGGRSETGNVKPHKMEPVLDAYLSYGRERAVTQCLMDMTRQHLSRTRVQMLVTLLVDRADYRSQSSWIHHVSGNRRETPEPSEIPKRMQKLIQRYHSALKQQRDHPLVIAAQLHHGIAAIQPFPSWNGRIARLLLNMALMAQGCLPVRIGVEERIDYYASLERADDGDLLPLVNLLARKQMDSIEEFIHSPEYLSIEAKYHFENRLQQIGAHQRCLVLTEDATTRNLLSALLTASGFNMEETELVSYEGCSKIASANLFSVFVKARLPHMKILVHRDRDYLTDSELEGQHSSFRKIDVRFFVTDGTDVESHFLRAAHVHHCYTSIGVRDAQALIDATIEEVMPKSLDYLYKKEFGSRKPGTTHLYGALERLLDRNRLRFTHGKTALRVLERRLQDRLRRKINLGRSSPALAHPKLVEVARSIWGS